MADQRSKCLKPTSQLAGVILGLTLGAAVMAQTDVAKLRSLMVDTDVRPAIGQFVPADDDIQYLFYELFIVNWQKEDLRLASIDVEDAATGKRLARYDSKALEDPIRFDTVPFAGKDGPDNRILRSGRTAVLDIIVKLPLGARLPAAVRHRIQFESDPNLKLILADGSESSELFAVSEPMAIDRRPPLVLGPPLRGGPWFCGNGLSESFTPHDTQYASAKIARIHVVARGGCDLAKVDAKSNARRIPTPDSISLPMFYGYGADVLAVADGLVIKTQDGIPDTEPRIDRKITMPVSLTDATVNGNMVALKIGEGQYAFYAHLQPGSIRVREGDLVRKGQPLAKLGNSGNTDGPHLHFHVGRGPEINATEFLPYVFTSYWLEGHNLADPAKRKRVGFRAPIRGSIMTFPSR